MNTKDSSAFDDSTKFKPVTRNMSSNSSSSSKNSYNLRKRLPSQDSSQDGHSSLDSAMTSSLYSVSGDTSGTLANFPQKASKYIMLTLGCCMLNVLFLEYIIKSDPGAGNLITFCQFAFISFMGIFTWWQFGKRSNQVPMKYHLVTVILFWSVNFCNNLAFKYSIPMTLHTIFRSGSLVTNMLLGMIIVGKRYSFQKYFSVFFISIGIFICTIMSANKNNQKGESNENDQEEETGFEMATGIILLCYALIVSSLMGLIQEYTYKRFGKHPDEALFIDHLLGLPCFYFFSDSIQTSFTSLLNSEPYNPSFFFGLLEFKTGIPTGIVFLILNLLCSYCCIKSVFVLTTECTSLTVTLVITIRKFLTLLVSIFYFGNDFSFFHWMGTFMVFSGALLYAEMFGMGLFRKGDGQEKKAQ